MNEDDTEVWTGKTVAKGAAGMVLRVVGVLFWLFVFGGFLFSGAYGNALKAIVGVMALLVGAIALLSPKKALGERLWFNAIFVFYGLGLLNLVL
jgi:hypothetical protein